MSTSKKYDFKHPSRTPRKTPRRFNWMIIVGSSLLVGGLILGGLEMTDTVNLISNHKNPPTSTADSGTTYAPPTEEEKQAGEQQKKVIIDEQSQQPVPPPAPSAKKNVQPAIVSASVIDGQVDVRGFVSGVFEEDGTCTARFTNGVTTLTKTTTGFEDFNKTTCRPITFAQTEMPGAGWSVTLKYESTTAEGTSDAVTIQ